MRLERTLRGDHSDRGYIVNSLCLSDSVKSLVKWSYATTPIFGSMTTHEPRKKSGVFPKRRSKTKKDEISFLNFPPVFSSKICKQSVG